MLTENEAPEGPTLNAQELTQALAHTPGADEWQLDLVCETEAQLYLLGTREESRRVVANERARIAVYNDHVPNTSAEGSEVARGMTSITLLGSEAGSGERVAGRLRDAVTIASLTDNPPFDLPHLPAHAYPRVETSDPALGHDLALAAQIVRARLEAAVASRAGVRLSSAEVFATRGSRELRNSRGLVGLSEGTRVFVDCVLIARDGGREAEFHAELSRRRIEDLRIEETVDVYASFAHDSLHATMPDTHTGPVILSGEALPSLFSPLIFHSSARAAYQHLSRLTVGEPVTPEPPRGDRLTLSSDALRPFGVRTAPFDEYGVRAVRVPVIEDGVLRQYWADARYGAYLGVPVTGDFANLTIERGTASLMALRSPMRGTVYEIVAFSWLNPDAVSGDFVAEIKLGYRHDLHGTTPIKGGSLSGNLFAALTDARLSYDSYSDGMYYGPAAIRFGELTIAGS